MSLHLYTAPTPHCQMVLLALGELRLEYTAVVVDVAAGELDAPWLRAMSPQGRVPVLVDTREDNREPFVIAEPGAILLHLAETAERMWSPNQPNRARTLHWLFYVVTELAPACEDALHDPSDAATARVLAALEQLELQLSRTRSLAPGGCSLADLAAYPFACLARAEGWWLERAEYLDRWMRTMEDRAGVKRAMRTPHYG